MATLLLLLNGLDLAKILSVLGAVTVALHALIAVFMLLPGEQPEKALQGIVDLIEKFSKK